MDDPFDPRQETEEDRRRMEQQREYDRDDGCFAFWGCCLLLFVFLTSIGFAAWALIKEMSDTQN